MSVSQVINKLKSINPWHFLWITVILSEIFTLIANSIQGYLRWGAISYDLLMIGSIDALFVPIVVAPIIIFFLKRTEEITKTNARLQEEIRERRTAEEALQQEKAFTEGALNTLQETFFVFDLEGRFLRWNKALEKVTGYNKAEIAVMKPTDFFPQEEAHLATKAIERVIEEGHSSLEASVLTKDRRLIPYQLTGSLIKGATGAIIGVCGIGTDITQRRRLEEELRILTIKDELTGLYNRRGFLTLGEHLLKMADRLRKSVFMLYADLDNMKMINDTFGHQEGDRVLIEFADILKENFRTSDIIARIGGDEFAVMPVGVLGDNVELIRNRLDKSLEIHNGRVNRNYDLSVSAGVAYYDPENPCSVNELLVQGDSLMYEEKKKKKEM